MNKIALILRKLFPHLYQKLLNIKQGRYNYNFSKEKYPHSFLADNHISYNSDIPAPEVIYCFWTGDNPLTENRKKGLKTLEKYAKIPIKLITPENLSEYIKPNFPLHKGYDLLSLTAKSDYLRCYFMHHHGGGYADIKPFNHSWKSAFAKLNKHKDKYIIGYPELLFAGLAPIEDRFLPNKSLYPNYKNILDSEKKLFQDLTKHTPLLIGNCAFVCKPYSPITSEWYKEIHHRMDKLCEYTYIEREKTLNLKDITLPYFYLVQVFHPIILKYHKHVLRDKKLLPILKNYR